MTQSDAPRRLHPLTLLFATLGIARQLVFPAIVGGLSRADGDPGRLVGWVVAILSIPALIIGTLRYLGFRYRVSGEELVIDSGVLRRQHRVIPLSRVQNIDLRESALQRVLGVVEVHVETAGAGRGAEASLDVLSRADAESLRAELLARRRTAREASSPIAPDPELAGERVQPTDEEIRPVVLARLTPVRLALAGATANEAGLIAAALAGGLQLVDELAIERVIPLAEWWERASASTLSGAIWFIVLVLAALLVLGWLVSIVGSVVGYHDFTLERVGGELRKHYGLLGRRQTTVPLERVQGIRIEESLLRRPLGLAALKIETAGGTPGQQRRSGSEAFVPIAGIQEVPALVRGVFADLDVGAAVFEPVHPRSLRRGFLRNVTAVVVVLAVVAATTWVRRGEVPRELPLSMLPLGALAYAFAAWQYRHRGWALVPGYVLARAGVLNRVTWIVPDEKIQTVHLTMTPFQRRHGLSTLIIDTASGGRQGRVADIGGGTPIMLVEELAVRARTRGREKRGRGNAALRAVQPPLVG